MAFVDGFIRRPFSRNLAAFQRYAQQTSHQRTNGILALTDTERQDEATVMRDALVRGDARELLHQTCLADTRFTANVKTLSMAFLDTGFQYAPELHEIRPPAHQRCTFFIAPRLLR